MLVRLLFQQSLSFISASSDLKKKYFLSSGAGSGAGHLQLFRSCIQWLETCKNYLVEKNVIEKLETNIPSGRHLIMVEHTCLLLNYVS